MQFNLADLWERVVDEIPDHESMVCGERRLTYAEADERANRLAHHLAGLGIGAGDHVALYLYNGTEYLEGMLAAFKLRAVPINVNYRYGEEELRYLLDDADAKAVVFHREFSPTLAAVRAALPQLTGIRRGRRRLRRGGVARRDGVRGGARGRITRATSRERSADDLYILYTGGTTGMPKGVMWRAEDIFFGAFGGGNLGDAPITAPEQIVDALEPHRRGLPACPFMHGTAHWMAFGTLYSGGTVVMSPDRHLDPVRLWQPDRARARHVPRDRRRRVRPSARRGPRPPRPRARRQRADRRPLRWRGALAVGEGGVGRAPARRAAHRRLRRVGDRRPGPERVGRRRSDRDRAALPRERRDHRARRRPAPAPSRARSASWPGAVTCRSGTTATRRSPRRRSR